MALLHPFKGGHWALPLTMLLFSTQNWCTVLSFVPASSATRSSTLQIFQEASHSWQLICLPVYLLKKLILACPVQFIHRSWKMDAVHPQASKGGCWTVTGQSGFSFSLSPPFLCFAASWLNVLPHIACPGHTHCPPLPPPPNTHSPASVHHPFHLYCLHPLLPGIYTHQQLSLDWSLWSRCILYLPSTYSPTSDVPLHIAPIHPTHPSLAHTLTNTCLSCHGPLRSRCGHSFHLVLPTSLLPPSTSPPPPPPTSPSTHTHQYLPLLPLTLAQQMWPFISSGTAYPPPPIFLPPPIPKHTHSPTSAINPCATDAAIHLIWLQILPTSPPPAPRPPSPQAHTLTNICLSCHWPLCSSCSHSSLLVTGTAYFPPPPPDPAPHQAHTLTNICLSCHWSLCSRCSHSSHLVTILPTSLPPSRPPSTHTHQHLSLLPLILVQQMRPFISSGYRYCLPPPPRKHTHSPTSVSPATDPCAADVAELPCVPPSYCLAHPGPDGPLLHCFGVEPSLVCLVHAWTQLACLSTQNIPWGYIEEVGDGGGGVGWNPLRSVWYMPGPSLHVCQYKHPMRIHRRGGGGGGGGGAVELSEVCVVHAWTQFACLSIQTSHEDTSKRWWVVGGGGG